jgi:hypothetical protein
LRRSGARVAERNFSETARTTILWCHVACTAAKRLARRCMPTTSQCDVGAGRAWRSQWPAGLTILEQRWVDHSLSVSTAVFHEVPIRRTIRNRKTIAADDGAEVQTATGSLRAPVAFFGGPTSAGVLCGCSGQLIDVTRALARGRRGSARVDPSERRSVTVGCPAA